MDRHHLDRSARALIKSQSISITFKENYVILLSFLRYKNLKSLRTKPTTKTHTQKKKWLTVVLKKERKKKRFNYLPVEDVGAKQFSIAFHRRYVKGR